MKNEPHAMKREDPATMREHHGMRSKHLGTRREVHGMMREPLLAMKSAGTIGGGRRLLTTATIVVTRGTPTMGGGTRGTILGTILGGTTGAAEGTVSTRIGVAIITTNGGRGEQVDARGRAECRSTLCKWDALRAQE